MLYTRAKVLINMVHNRKICFFTIVLIKLGGKLNMVMFRTILHNRDDIILQIIQSYLKKFTMLDVSIYSYI